MLKKLLTVSLTCLILALSATAVAQTPPAGEGDAFESNIFGWLGYRYLGCINGVDSYEAASRFYPNDYFEFDWVLGAHKIEIVTALSDPNQERVTIATSPSALYLVTSIPDGYDGRFLYSTAVETSGGGLVHVLGPEIPENQCVSCRVTSTSGLQRSAPRDQTYGLKVGQMLKVPSYAWVYHVDPDTGEETPYTDNEVSAITGIPVEELVGIKKPHEILAESSQ